MASKVTIKTTFEVAKTIQPVYTGGDIALDKSGKLVASCLDEDALIFNLETGEQLARVEGVSQPDSECPSLCLLTVVRQDGEAITSLSSMQSLPKSKRPN